MSLRMALQVIAGNNLARMRFACGGRHAEQSALSETPVLQIQKLVYGGKKCCCVGSKRNQVGCGLGEMERNID